MGRAFGDLVFYISHTDSFSEVCRLLKIGKVRVHLSPAPEVGASFREELNIREGRLVVDLGGTHLELFVDAHHPVIDIAGHSDQPRTVTVSQEGWRTERRVLTGTERDRSAWTMKGAPADVEVTEDPDVIVPATQAPGAIAWYHRNETSIVPLTLKHEGVDQVPGTFDPLLHRTFGAWIEGIGFSRQADGTLATARFGRVVRSAHRLSGADCGHGGRLDQGSAIGAGDGASARSGTAGNGGGVGGILESLLGGRDPAG